MVKKITNSGLVQFILATIDGKKTSYKSGNFFIPSIVALVLWIVISSVGLQDVFMRLGQIQSMANAMGNASNEWNKLKKNPNSYWNNFSMKEDDKKMPPFVKVTIANLAAIAALCIFLKIMTNVAKAKANIKDVITDIGIPAIVLDIGVIISFIFFYIADSLTIAYVPGILYLFGTITSSMCLMTCFLMFYTCNQNMLKLKERKRFWATTWGVLVLVGVFAVTSRLLL